MVHDGTIYVPNPKASEFPGETPTTRLIEGICAEVPNFSRAILRERIFTANPLTPNCLGMIKVVAKRARVLSPIEYRECFAKVITENKLKIVTPEPAREFKVDLHPPKMATLAEAAQFAKTLLPQSKKPVAAVLLDAGFSVLAYAWNTNSENRCLHAEINLIHALRMPKEQRIPNHATLITTLKPCAMCAAQIFSAASQVSTLKIYYLEDDPGPMAKNSVLMHGSDLWMKAGKPEIQLARLSLS